ncbi:hypothetical protein [Streptomyces paradoxus]|uniref:hypothetical protein n=1 Tax=Streptomyces paradoxus TaxID=66375 RepID=UPI0038021302
MDVWRTAVADDVDPIRDTAQPDGGFDRVTGSGGLAHVEVVARQAAFVLDDASDAISQFHDLQCGRTRVAIGDLDVGCVPAVVELHASRRTDRLKGEAIQVLLGLDCTDVPRDPAQDPGPLVPLHAGQSERRQVGIGVKAGVEVVKRFLKRQARLHPHEQDVVGHGVNLRNGQGAT